jgi:hypothetical protein
MSLPRVPPLKFQHHSGVEAKTVFRRVSALVCQHAGRTKLVIYVAVGVSMEPQRDSTFRNKGVEIRAESWRKGAVSMNRCFGSSAGCMMGYDDCASWVTKLQLLFYPGD